MWAFGVMLFEMLVGTKPFRGPSNIFLLFCKIMKEETRLCLLRDLGQLRHKFSPRSAKVARLGQRAHSHVPVCQGHHARWDLDDKVR